MIKDASYKAIILAAFTDLQSTVIYGNILSHNNSLAEQLSITEVKSFCESIHNLHATLLCPHCRNLVKYYRDIHKIRCSNNKCGKFEVDVNE